MTLQNYCFFFDIRITAKTQKLFSFSLFAQKMHIFLSKFTHLLHMSKKSCTFAAKVAKLTKINK